MSRDEFHIENVALKKSGLVFDSSGVWGWCRVEAIGPDTLVELSRWRPKKSGPNKGGRLFYGERQRAIVTRAEVEAQEAEYERQTGRCHYCYGEGDRAVGWNRDAGEIRKVCGRCGGSGKAPGGVA